MNPNDIDSSVLGKFQLQTAVAGETMGLLPEVVHSSVAAVTDLVSSTWNSLTPEKYNTSTGDLLSRIDKDALQVYNEHPDLIHTASMIGGVFLPVGLAMKGMTALRTGAKGVSWFSREGELTRLKAVETAFKNAIGVSEAVGDIKKSMYAAMAANAMIDSVAAEAAIVLTMNAHPYMEDYMDDLPSNFLLWAAVGGGISIGVGAIGVKASVARIGKTIESDALASAFGGMQHVPASANLGNQLLIRSQNVKNLEASLARNADPLDPFILTNNARAVSEHILVKEKASIINTFENMAAGELKEAPVELKTMLSGILKDDARFAYADTIAWAKVSEGITEEGIAKTGLLQDAQKFLKTLTNNKGGSRITQNKLVYLPEHDAFVSLRESNDYLSLADTGKSIEELRATPLKEFSVPRPDAFLESQYMSTAKVEEDAARTVLAIGNMDAKMLNSLVINPDDRNLISAIIARISKMEPSEAVNVKVLMTREAPTYGAQQQATFKGAGFSPKYLDSLKALDAKREQYHIYSGKQEKLLDTSISERTRELIYDWVHVGDARPLRTAALQIINPSVTVRSIPEARDAIIEMMGSARSVAFRAELYKIADSEGNVLLYRGLKADPSGHHALESYSLNPGKAKAFASGNPSGLRLYKVHVDNVIASLEDFGTTLDTAHSNGEILVINKQTRESAVIPLDDLSATPSKFFSAEGELTVSTEATIPMNKQKAGLPELLSALEESTWKLEKELKSMNLSSEAIAKRIGFIPTNSNMNSIRFSGEEDILKALNPEKRAFELGTNMNKVPFSELRSNLNINSIDNMNLGILEQVIMGSTDPVIRELGVLLGSPSTKNLMKHLLAGLTEVTPSALRSTIFRSANSAVESFGVSGTIATMFGKDVTHFSNRMREALVTPIAKKMAEIAKKESLIVETNLALTVNASIKGNRVYRDGQFFVKEMDELTNKMVDVAVQYNGRDFKIANKEVQELFEAFDVAGKTVYSLGNAKNKILGKGNLANTGFWVPSFNPRNKELAYVIDHSGKGTSILWAKTAEELNDKVVRFTESAKVAGRNVEVVTRDSSLEYFNKLVGREEDMFMQMADVAQHHSGSSANAVISTNTELMTEVVNSYDHLVNKGITNLVDIQLQPVMDKLQLISELSQRGHNIDAMGNVQKSTKALVDPGLTMRNILLGRNQLDQHQGWLKTQEGIQVFTDLAISKISEITTPIMQKLGTTHGRDEKTFELLNQQMLANGHMPFSAVDDFLRYQKEGVVHGNNLTPRAIALSNNIAATTLLKFLEMAQPLVNAISLPILTSGAMRKEMAKNFMGADLAGLPKHYGVFANFGNAIRLMNHPVEGIKWSKKAESLNLFKSVVSEADEAMKNARSLDPGAMAKAEEFFQSQFITKGSFLSNWSESLVRRVSFFNGVTLAKRAYPGLSDDGVMVFARSFMDEAVGNYSASQRPAAFQGTFGVALGLFQTYMLTMAQQLYRGIERKDWIGLSKQMFAQATIFGGSSLPGFHVVSEQIGTHFSDQHIDLETGLFRAIGDTNATTLLYGAPSLFGLGTTTRGDIQPRLPNPIDGLDSIAAVNLTKQAWKASETLASAATQANGDIGKAFMEALSVQSISRPVARMSELLSGESLTGKGNVVASGLTANPMSEKFWEMGTLARVMSTRPIEEIKAREAIHLDSVYKSVEGDKRRAVTARLKTSIRNGTLSGEEIQALQLEYLKVGSPQGWRSAYREALMEKVRGGTISVKDRLKDSAVYQVMVDDLD